MGAPENVPLRSRGPALRRAGALLAVLVLAGLVVFALSRLELGRVGHDLVTASLGWIALSLLLMSLAMLMRSVSWHQALRAALPGTPMPWPAVVRATMIGVMGSALVPGRIGEPTRVLVLSRRLDGRTSRLLPVVAGTVFSQTLINLLALAILLAVTITSVPLAERPSDRDRDRPRAAAGGVRAGHRRAAPAGARPPLALAARGARG